MPCPALPPAGVRRAAPYRAGPLDPTAARHRGLRRHRLLGRDPARRRQVRLPAPGTLLLLPQHRDHPLRRAHPARGDRRAAADPAQHGSTGTYAGAPDSAARVHATLRPRAGGPAAGPRRGDRRRPRPLRALRLRHRGRLRTATSRRSWTGRPAGPRSARRRDPNPHLGFGGGGPHSCLGKSFAVLEIDLVFDAVADAMPGLRLADSPRRLRSAWINGVKELRVSAG